MDVRTDAHALTHSHTHEHTYTHTHGHIHTTRGTNTTVRSVSVPRPARGRQDNSQAGQQSSKAAARQGRGQAAGQLFGDGTRDQGAKQQVGSVIKQVCGVAFQEEVSVYG